MDPDSDSLKIKLFADGADLTSMIEMASRPYISGLTTNPTLMRKSGVTDYAKFAREVLEQIPIKPISFEVFSDDLDEMKVQALKIASWGENVYVKIPITNTKGTSTKDLISFLSHENVKINITAIMNSSQVEPILEVLNTEVPSYISVFAGRIADTGRNPIPIMKDCLKIMFNNSKSELIWASPRELLNIFQAEEIGCHVITATSDILNKIKLIGKDLSDYSLETVRMFHDDAKSAGYSL
jgi:transaldolase